MGYDGSMSLPPITGALTTACAAVAALTTVIAFAAIGSTKATEAPTPNPHAPRLWRSRTPPVGNASVQRMTAPAPSERSCVLVEPLVAEELPVIRVLGLPLGLVRVPLTVAAPSTAQVERSPASKRPCDQSCDGARAGATVD